MKRSTYVKALEGLRNPNIYQITGNICDGEGGYCANGAIALALGLDTTPRTLGRSVIAELHLTYGLDSAEILTMNDFDRVDFATIAQWLQDGEDDFVTEEDMTPEHVPSDWSELVEV